MMGIDTNGGGGCVFPLTSLQIGDLQSYLSRLNIFLVPDSEKFYILVDNSPWLEGLGLRSAWLWQLMVTKSRSSPFANMKTRRARKNGEDMIDLKSVSTSNSSKPQRFKRWFALIDALMLSQKRVLIPVKNLKRTLLLNSEFHKTLYGFIIFEVAWSSVRGINYLNELQTDTSLAVEAKVMRRWGFDTIAQAATYLSSWFSEADSERLLWKEYLESAAGEVYYDAEEDFLRCDSYDDSDDEFFSTHDMFGDDTSSDCHQIKFSVYPTSIENDMGFHVTPSLPGPYKRRKVTKSAFRGVEDGYSNETHRCTVESQDPSDNLCTSECGIGVGATEYRDVLILFKFNDRDLPFKLRQIIMSDLRLLTLLECGLPSWVIFLQSYPGFCHLYRPWMCPLARALYVLISVITVLIGFYDLYKNVPILKASAYRLCGPLLVWIETWDMVSRIKYLGTMLFLHNVQKAVGWFLAITHTMLSFLSLLAQPMTGPVLELLSYLLPIWNMCSEAAESLCMVIWTIVGSSIGLMGELTEVLLQPMWLILSFIWNVATFVVYPIFLIFWELLYAPVRLIVAMFSLTMSTFSCVSEFLAEMWRSLSTIFQFASASERAVSLYEVSMWRSLWNDLFSQVFRAVRSILNGFVAFFTACNRHRLSIYKHTLEFIQRLFGQRPSSADLKDGTHTCRVQALASFVSEARW